MNVLNEILRSLRLKGAVYFRAKFRAPWGMQIPRGEFANFHIVTRGSCWATCGEGRPPLKLQERDILLFPHGSAHSLLCEQDAPAQPAQEILARIQDSSGNDSEGVEVGGSGEATTTLICGHFEFEDALGHPLFKRLEDCVHIHPEAGEPAPWIALAEELMRNLKLNDGAGNLALADRTGGPPFGWDRQCQQQTQKPTRRVPPQSNPQPASLTSNNHNLIQLICSKRHIRFPC